MLFGENFNDKTETEVIDTLSSYQEASSIPMILAVDEEGGTVVRISSNPLLWSNRFASPQMLYVEGGFDAIRDDTISKSNRLLELGINLNLAPVADVSTNPTDFIYDRSFGQDATQTSIYVRLVVETMNQVGLASSLKHFPGYGNNVDTHTGSAIDNRPYSTFETSDFLPFRAGIEANVPFILVSHNIVNCLDSEHPASLSKNVHDQLRETLNYTGIIMTDDLQMSAISENFISDHPYVDAVLVGNDLLIVPDANEAYHQLLNAFQSGELTEERINESLIRLITFKLTLMH